MSSTQGKSSASRRHKPGADKLAALRKQMGWSPEDLGAIADVSGKWIRFIETTKHEPTDRIKSRLARPFGLLPWDIWRPTGSSPLSAHELEHLRELSRDRAAVPA